MPGLVTGGLTSPWFSSAELLQAIDKAPVQLSTRRRFVRAARESEELAASAFALGLRIAGGLQRSNPLCSKAERECSVPGSTLSS